MWDLLRYMWAHKPAELGVRGVMIGMLPDDAPDILGTLPASLPPSAPPLLTSLEGRRPK